MLTIDDFISKFSKYSDQELFEIHKNIEGYSEEAKMALTKVIEKKGGIDRLTNSIAESQQITVETKRIQKEIYELRQNGFDKDFIRKAISSKILSDENVNKIINEQYDYSTKDIEDKKIDNLTVSRCIMSGIIATLISGSLLGVFFMYTGAVHILILIGVALSCYAIIKRIVKKSKNNSAVFITTLISTIAAISLGFLLFNLFGARL